MPISPDSPRLGLTFRTRLLLSMCILVLLTGAAITFIADQANRASARSLTDSLFREVTGHAATQTRDFVLRAAPVAQSLDELTGHGVQLDNLDTLAPQLLAFLKGNPGMTRILYANELGGYADASRNLDGSFVIQRRSIQNGQSQLTTYAVQPDDSLKPLRHEENTGYDARKRPFYTLAKDTGKLTWTPPYMFFTENLPGISCVLPVFDADRTLKGVFSVEFDLNTLSQFASTLSISKNSRVFLFTPDRTLLAHPNQRSLIGKGVKGKGQMLTLADTADPLVDAFSANLNPEFLSTPDTGGFHFFGFKHNGTSFLASTTVFPIGDSQQWVVGAIAPESDFLSGVWRARWLSLAAAAVALALAAVVAAITARRISSPVQSLIAFMHRVGNGDLDARADFQGGHEFQLLSNALNKMIVDLRERLHLRSSLKIAMDVQQSLLPASDPVSPLLDIAGHSKYCDDTGGDYYDFIDVSTLSPSSLLIAVGDVMGHGIPAALVMATARAALRTCARQDHSLAQLMTRTNQVLSQDNRHKRFMTLSLLLIDTQSRTVRWASAGHDPAIVFDPQTQSFSELAGGDLLLGVMEDVQYEEYTSNFFPPDSILVIGTDGVWEMFNEQKQQYGKQRLQAVMQANHTKTAAQIRSALDADLAAFRGIASPADDVTFVIIKFLPTPTI